MRLTDDDDLYDLYDLDDLDDNDDDESYRCKESSCTSLFSQDSCMAVPVPRLPGHWHDHFDDEEEVERDEDDDG